MKVSRFIIPILTASVIGIIGGLIFRHEYPRDGRKIEYRLGGYQKPYCLKGISENGPICGAFALGTCCNNAPGGGSYDYYDLYYDVGVGVGSYGKPKRWVCQIDWRGKSVLCSPEGFVPLSQKRAKVYWSQGW